MKSQVEIERLLERLGSEWPANGSFINDVMRDIESQSVHLELQKSRWPLMRSFLATAAAATILAALWWILQDGKTLYAQAVEGIRRARTFHMTTTASPDTNKAAQQVIQSWYARGVGFREEFDSEVRLGNQKNFWTYVKESKLAIRSQSHNIDDIVDRMLSNEVLQLLKEQQMERYPVGDQQIDDQPCRAYLLSKFERAVDPDWKTGKKRLVILLDDQSRIARAVTEVRSNDRWIAQSTTDWNYDLSVDPALFEPHFGDNVTIIDADAVFDEFVDLQKAIHREERSGLVYAIHRAERFEDGGILIVSSVRGTAETLKKYPLALRRIQPGRFLSDGPAVNYAASPLGEGYLRIDLASADHQGINVRWWVLVPRGTQPIPFDIAPDKVKLPVGITPCGEFAKANFMDKHGVVHHLTWQIVLDLPESKSLPTLEAIARHVYTDQISLEAVPCRQLNMGAKEGVEQFSEPSKTTSAEFSKAVTATVLWWVKQ